MAPTSPNFPQDYEPVSPIDLTTGPKRTRSVAFANPNAADDDDKDETQVRTRSVRTDSSSSTTPSLKSPRKARFAEATSVLSPAVGPGESRSPFADPKMAEGGPKPSDVGFGYIADSQPREQFATVRSETNGPNAPLKSALKTPGTAGRLLNPLSPTFKEEMDLERQEEKTDKEQAKDLKIKTRVRVAKIVLRGVNFSCSLIVLAMLSTVLTIFHATKSLPARNNLPAWAPKTPIWPQIVVLTFACISLLFAVVILVAYCCKGGHKRAEKVAVYYTMFALGWFMFSIIMWLVGAGVLQGTKSSGGGQDLWGWSCKDNKRRELFEEDVHYALVCRLQDWALICCIIEVVVEVIVIAIYGIVFYRFWSKNRLRKSMDARDRARTDLYLAQLRSQSAPNTPGFAQTPRTGKFHDVSTPRTPGFPTMMGGAKAPMDDDDDDSSAQYANTTPNSNTATPFKLQAPPSKHTPRNNTDGFEPAGPSASPPPQDRYNEHVAAAPGEQTYDAVPIPGAYESYQHQQQHESQGRTF